MNASTAASSSVPRASVRNLAHKLELRDVDAWDRLVEAYERVDPRAVLPVQIELVEAALVKADAHQYRLAARRLRRNLPAVGVGGRPAVQIGAGADERQDGVGELGHAAHLSR